MNAIPLINNAPRPNINVGSIGSPAFNPVAAGAKLGGSIGGNVIRQNPASMPVNNETQLRQEVNTSIVALKREAFSLENLIAQAAQTLQDINKRLSELEGKQGDYVKKADATVSSVGGDGKYISAISETDGKINATATDLGNMVPVNSVTSGNMHSVTSNAVAGYSAPKVRNKNQLAVFTEPSNWGIEVNEQQYPSTSTMTWQPMVNVTYEQDGKNNSLGFFRNDLSLVKNATEQYFVVLNEMAEGAPVVIRHKEMTAMTNQYGTFPLTTEKPIYIKAKNLNDAMCIVGYGSNIVWIKIVNYDYTPITMTTVIIDMYYI